MADFPGAIFTPRTTSNLPGVVYDPTKTKEVFAEDYSKPAAEIAEIETILGTNPQGAYATVKAWLNALVSALSGKQDSLGFTPEDVSNKKTTLADNSDTFYPSQKAVKTAVDGKVSSQWVDGGSGKLYYNSGNVGIGTTGPGAKLAVNGGSILINSDQFLYGNTADSNGNAIRLYNGGTGYMNFNVGYPTGGFTFGNQGNEKVRIDNNGNVGIGTTGTTVFDLVGSTRPLVVAGSDASTAIGGSGATLAISNKDTTADNTAALAFTAITGASTNHYASAEIVGIFGPRTNSQYPTGKLAFLTSTALNMAPTEKVRIDNLGNVGIGITSPTAKLHLKAGTATAGTAPMKLTAGTLLTTPELGAMEYTDNGTDGHLYFTLNVGGTVTRVQII